MQVDRASVKLASLDIHTAFRLYSGILEGPEIEDTLPYYSNMDFLNGISLIKGWNLLDVYIYLLRLLRWIRSSLEDFPYGSNKAQNCFLHLGGREG